MYINTAHYLFNQGIKLIYFLCTPVIKWYNVVLQSLQSYMNFTIMSDECILGSILWVKGHILILACCVGVMCRGSHIASVVLPHFYRVLNQRDTYKHPVIHILGRN